MDELEEILSNYFNKSKKARLNKPISFEKGEIFEDYVRDTLFPKERYKLLHKTHSYEQNSKDYPEDSMDPDYKFEDEEYDIIFHVECKYRDISQIEKKADELIAKFEQRNKKTTTNSRLEEETLDRELTKNDTISIFPKEQQLRFLELNKKEKVLLCLGLFLDTTNNIYIHVIPIEDLLLNSANLLDLEYYIVANNYPVVSDRIWELYDQPKKCYCIRCKEKIIERPSQPLCRNCLPIWQKYSNFQYIEKYCHSCGKETSVSVAKPECIDCYRNFSDPNYRIFDI